MRKAYITPILMVEEAEVADGLLTVTSIKVSDDSGNEEYVKEQSADDSDWDLGW